MDFTADGLRQESRRSQRWHGAFGKRVRLVESRLVKHTIMFRNRYLTENPPPVFHTELTGLSSATT